MVRTTEERTNVLMQGGDDPVKPKADLSDALKEDMATTGNKWLKDQLEREANYLAGKAKW